ncbi:MAG: RidA family protein [Alphaproteobacteria bacterium]|jgi:2-iminobutanoate/2-iminopropanoate deaminase|nr:RidA family protein [Alphaproteobacteria bacterium]
MSLKHIHSDETPAPLSAHSDAVLIPPGAAILVSSGQLGMLKDGTIPEDTEQQIEAAFDNVEAVLRAAGMTMSDVVKMTTFITDPRYRDAFRAVRAERVGNPPPSSTRIVVTSLSMPEMKVEIEIIAAKVP